MAGFVTGLVGLKVPKSDFDLFISMLKNFWQLAPTAFTKLFFIKKHIQRTRKTPYTDFQMCWDFISRLGSKSESGEPKTGNL